MSGDALVALLTEKLNAAMGSPPEDDDVIATLEELIPRVRTKFRFIYDFGDHWDHQIEVEAIHPPASDLKSQRPRCVDGARGNPLEDCGGPWRFAGLLEAREDRNHPSREQLEEFGLQRWDLAKFSVASADKKLAGMFGRQPFRKESES